eukprot:SAG11_NODE_3262_length_2571_cov_2.300971_3_plen_120_part_00
MREDSLCHPVFHVTRLKAWSDPGMIKYRKKPKKRLPAELRFKDGDDWEVEEILDDAVTLKSGRFNIIMCDGREERPRGYRVLICSQVLGRCSMHMTRSMALKKDKAKARPQREREGDPS